MAICWLILILEVCVLIFAASYYTVFHILKHKFWLHFTETKDLKSKKACHKCKCHNYLCFFTSITSLINNCHLVVIDYSCLNSYRSFPIRQKNVIVNLCLVISCTLVSNAVLDKDKNRLFDEMSKWQSERSIHEMLKDTPPLRESSDSITSGTEAKFPTSRSMPFPPAYAPPDVSQNGAAGNSTLLRAGSTKIESIKNWSVSTYKCTKQLLYEKLGKSSRTVDTELEAQIGALRETQRKYAGVLRLSAALAAQLAAAAGSQRALGEAFADLAQKSPELQNQFLYNADTQRSLTRNGETLLAALHFFNNALNTLTNKTMEDTLLTIRQYEAARVEYDAYRSELEASGGNPPELLLAAIERHRRHYERLRDDSAVKLKLLHENRVKVMNKQLLLFHNAVSAYFSGNNVALEAAVRHFSVPVPSHQTNHPPLTATHTPLPSTQTTLPSMQTTLPSTQTTLPSTQTTLPSTSPPRTA